MKEELLPPSGSELGASERAELRWARALALVVTLCAAAAQLWPVAGAPTRWILGVPEGEAMAHLWGLVVAATGLSQLGPYVRDTTMAAWPGGIHLDLVDPLHLLLVAPGLWLFGLPGAALAWNALHTLHLLVLAVGAWLLARVVAPSRPLVAALATAGALATPYLWSGLMLGRSELLGLLTLPLLLALLARAWRPGAGRGSVLAAAAALWSIAACGWQPLMFLALVGTPAALVLAGHLGLPWRRVLSRSLACVLPAALLSLPMLLVQLADQPWWLGRLGGMSVLGADAPPVDVLGALRLTAWQPSMNTVVPPYPGWVALGLLALSLRRGSRRWALLGVGLLVLELGPRIDLGDPTTRYLAPVWLLATALPPLGGLNDWGRLALAVGPMLALAGALGLAPWLRGRRGLGLVVLTSTLLLADGLSFRLDTPQRLAWQPPALLTQVYDYLPDGPVLELPGIAPDQTEAQSDNDRSMLWALSHGHPVQATPSPYGSPALAGSVLMRVHLRDAHVKGGPCVRTESGRLYAWGFRSVVLLVDRLPNDVILRTERRTQAILGVPAGRSGTLIWWRLAAGPVGPDSCSPPPAGAKDQREAGSVGGASGVGLPPQSHSWPG